jgi:hypothetical protein
MATAGIFNPESVTATPTTAVKKGTKRRLSGFGTDSGPYSKVKPQTELWQEQFATPQGGLNGDCVTFEVEVPRNQILR